MPAVVAVVGRKKSGKTTTIEILTKALTERGYKTAAVKHIPEPNFTIDKEGKDTWKYAQSGAKIVVSVSTDEIATIEKTKSGNPSLKAILRRCRGSDVVFLEGFRNLVAKNKDVYKIVIARSSEEVIAGLETFDPILAFTGPFRPRIGRKRIPYVDMRKNPEKLADVVENAVIKESAT